MNSTPDDDMPSRATLAQELLLFRIQMISETFYQDKWIEDIEFDVWKMSFESPARLAGHPVTAETAKNFRDLYTLAGGWWGGADLVGQDSTDPVFIPKELWNRILKKRGTSH